MMFGEILILSNAAWKMEEGLPEPLCSRRLRLGCSRLA
jgi:hypothetical protein